MLRAVLGSSFGAHDLLWCASFTDEHLHLLDFTIQLFDIMVEIACSHEVILLVLDGCVMLPEVAILFF